jgi:hypothetical protein
VFAWHPKADIRVLRNGGKTVLRRSPRNQIRCLDPPAIAAAAARTVPGRLGGPFSSGDCRLQLSLSWHRASAKSLDKKVERALSVLCARCYAAA